MARLLSEAIAAFTSNGVSVAHERFHELPDPPYAVTRLDDSEYGYGDDQAQHPLCEYEIVLSVTDRDLELEGAIENALAEADITFRKRGGHNPYDDLVTTTYRFSVYER